MRGIDTSNIMQSFFISSLFLLLCMGCEGNTYQPNWNGLKLRFGVFKDIARTEQDAIVEGFTRISNCDENPKFRGTQYVKDNDMTVILLFDVSGFIAGIQAGLPKGLPNSYPDVTVTPFIDDGEHFKLTAYFVDPAIICRRGRSEQQFKRQGTGTDLFIQNGTNPETDLIEIALEETETKWVKGKCFPRMGFHYFYKLSMDMRCETFLPVATLYYNGRLTGFVWSFGAILNSTVVPLEYPEPKFFEELMDEVPICLQTLRRSTLHIYFEGNPETAYDCKTSLTGSGVSMETLPAAMTYYLLSYLVYRLV